MGETTSSTRHGLGSLVEGYMRRKLHHEIHPAFETLKDNDGQSSIGSKALKPMDLVRDGAIMPIKQDQEPQNPDDSDDNDLNELYRDALLERDRFREAMEDYERTTAGSNFKTDVTSQSLHTWEEVLEEVNKSSEAYSSRATVWGKIRAGLHKLGDNSRVFEAAARLADLRHGIADALAEIPSLLTCIHQALKIFKGSKDLHRCSASLYVSTLAVLHHIVCWYKTKAIKKLCHSILRQDMYEEKMNSLLQDLRAQSGRFDKAAQLCSYEAIQETRHISIKNQQTLDGYVDRSTTQWDIFQNEIRSDKASTLNEIHSIQHQVSDLVGIMERFLGSHDRVDPKTLDVRGPLLPSDKASIERRSLQMYLRSRDHAFTSLNYTPSTLETDLTTNLRNIWQLPLPSQDRILATMQTPQLHTWITTAAPSALFLNLNTPATSPSSSFLLARLTQSINNRPAGNNNIYTLAFFCSAHLSPTDPNSGPPGMLRSLIAQLLESHPGFDLDTVRRISQTPMTNVHDLCVIFEELVKQLPPDVVVFCLVDGVTEFEDRAKMWDSGEEGIRGLLGVVERCVQSQGRAAGRCVFKLLLTSHRKSRRLWRLVMRQVGDVVWMPDKVPSSGGLTKGRWRESVEGKMDW
ncbi:hypothetical protein FE257_000587 [Aspergillus nanangensis]|uniref:Uncharacterized protein n=1 Tax=Aspergillus nanangensis TaxID=2582783 RepID=A0AAD4CGH6_ASPNN|nr:hypothetical protein FE257_000587 [Aspergillus nanangensis]